MPRYGEGAAVGTSYEKQPMSGKRIVGTGVGVGVTGAGLWGGYKGVLPQGGKELKTAEDSLKAAQTAHLRARSDLSVNQTQANPRNWRRELPTQGKPSAKDYAVAQRRNAVRAGKARVASPGYKRAVENTGQDLTRAHTSLKDLKPKVAAWNAPGAKLRRSGVGLGVAAVGAGSLYLTRRRNPNG
jgi:hypothetical protein